MTGTAARTMIRPATADRPQEMSAYPQEPVAALPAARDLDASVEHYVREFEALVSEGGLDGEPPAVTALRRAAIGRFGELGFPTTKNEDWHFTSVAPISSRSFRAAPAGEAAALSDFDLDAFGFGHPEWPMLVFVNGRTATRLWRGREILTGRGVDVRSLHEALRNGDAPVLDQLGSVAGFEAAAFTALNTAFFTDGIVLRVPRDTVLEAPIHLVHVSAGREPNVITHPRVLVTAGRGSRAAVIETYIGVGEGPYLSNAVTEIVLEEGSWLDHIKVQREARSSFHVGTSETRQARDSTYHSFSYATGAELSRSNIYTVLAGEGAGAILNGLYMVDGVQHVDHQTRIEHASPNCYSRELYKGVLDERAHGVFNGKVFVRPEAQKTDGKQSNNNLLLSPEARVDTKPQLEIFADDVKCTHGATVGRLDENALFYMRSRGIEPERARTLLTYAFAAEVLEEIEIPAVREGLEGLVLARVGAAGEL